MKMVKVVMAGVLSAFLPIELDHLQESLMENVPQGLLESNVKALELGSRAVDA